jgi:hypothetical protein
MAEQMRSAECGIEHFESVVLCVAGRVNVVDLGTISQIPAAAFEKQTNHLEGGKLNPSEMPNNRSLGLPVFADDHHVVRRFGLPIVNQVKSKLAPRGKKCKLITSVTK